MGLLDRMGLQHVGAAACKDLRWARCRCVFFFTPVFICKLGAARRAAFVPACKDLRWARCRWLYVLFLVFLRVLSPDSFFSCLPVVEPQLALLRFG